MGRGKATGSENQPGSLDKGPEARPEASIVRRTGGKGGPKPKPAYKGTQAQQTETGMTTRSGKRAREEEVVDEGRQVWRRMRSTIADGEAEADGEGGMAAPADRAHQSKNAK